MAFEAATNPHAKGYCGTPLDSKETKGSHQNLHQNRQVLMGVWNLGGIQQFIGRVKNDIFEVKVGQKASSWKSFASWKEPWEIRNRVILRGEIP